MVQIELNKEDVGFILTAINIIIENIKNLKTTEDNDHLWLYIKIYEKIKNQIETQLNKELNNETKI